MTNPPLKGAVRELATEALALALVLSEAESVQWSPSIKAKPREDTTERASGGISDPTLATVLDERRVAVRQAVDLAHSSLSAAVEALRDARTAVEEAVNSWSGN